MALILDAGSAKISIKTTGAAAGVEVGREFIVLHCTKNANVGAGNAAPPGKVNTGSAVEVEGTVFLEANANEFDIGAFEFGMVQISQLSAYQFLYAGRLASEGSVTIDLRLGYTVDQHIFNPNNLTADRVTQGRKGFNIKVRFGDHPFNAIPLKFENRVAAAPNFIARTTRREEFVAYFVAREKATTPIIILARIGWTVSWDAEFTWSAATQTPTKSIKNSQLFTGEPRTGAPNPPDSMSAVAVSRAGPTTNKMDKDATDAAWNQRRDPICKQSKDRPAGIPPNFFQ
jgi:hypothetical protein